MNEFLQNLNTVLREASMSDFTAMNKFFEKSKMWFWLGPEHLKVLLWLHRQGSGTYDIRTISEAVAVEDNKGEPWPGPVMIERLLQNLEDAGLVRVWWATKGIRSNQPFKIEADKLYHEWKMQGGFWNSLSEAIQSAGYRDLQALQRLYRETSLLRQPAFYLRVLAWAPTVSSGPVSSDAVKEEFANILKYARSEHDARDAESGLRWFHEKGLLNVTWDTTDGLIQFDVEPLAKWGFSIGGAE